MKYPAIAAAFYNTPHAITPEKLAEIGAFLTPRIFEDVRAFDTPPVTAGPRDGYQLVGRVAVVPVMGVIAQRMGMLSAFSGGVSTEQLGATIDSLVADTGVKSIVLNIESPGGSVYGVPELADRMLAARDRKKIVAVANSYAASAAYWLASVSSEIVVTPSGSVGSVGVIAAHQDTSKADEAAGYKTTLVTAGKYKAETDPSVPLSAEARDNLQAAVDAYYSMFVKSIAKGRGVSASKVDADFGQGRMLLAREAVAAGMADRVATLQQTLVRLGADEQAARGAGALRREAMARAAELGV